MAKVTMADVAERLGVSTVTVSKALAGKQGVSDTLRSEILETAKAMGYSKSERKMVSAQYSVGVIAGGRFMRDLHSFYWQIYQTLSREAINNRCFLILEIIGDGDEDAAKLPSLFRENNIDGVIMLGSFRKDYRRALSSQINVPVVWLDSDGIKGDCCCVVADNLYGAEEVCNHLFACGYQRIGFYGTIRATDSIEARYLGYLKAHLDHYKSAEDRWLIDDRGANGILYRPEEIDLPENLPEAFFCNCDAAAKRLFFRLRKEGYEVPGDIALAGFDHYVDGVELRDFFTTYEVDVSRMAESAIRLIREQINGQWDYGGRLVTPGRLIVGGSTKAYVK